MPQTCSICAHPERRTVDEQLVGGVSYRDIAAQHGVTPSALTRHRRAHLSPALKAVVLDREQAGAVSALDRFEDLYDQAKTILAALQADGNASKAVRAITAISGVLDKIARITGELDDRQVGVINIQTSPDWIDLRQRILRALDQHPDARADVIKALSGSHNRPELIA